MAYIFAFCHILVKKRICLEKVLLEVWLLFAQLQQLIMWVIVLSFIKHSAWGSWHSMNYVRLMCMLMINLDRNLTHRRLAALQKRRELRAAGIAWVFLFYFLFFLFLQNFICENSICWQSEIKCCLCWQSEIKESVVSVNRLK